MPSPIFLKRCIIYWGYPIPLDFLVYYIFFGFSTRFLLCMQNIGKAYYFHFYSTHTCKVRHSTTGNVLNMSNGRIQRGICFWSYLDEKKMQITETCIPANFGEVQMYYFVCMCVRLRNGEGLFGVSNYLHSYVQY